MQDTYKDSILNRTFYHQIIGLIARFKNYLGYSLTANIYVRKGARIGNNACIDSKVKIKNPKGLTIGNSTLVNRAMLDARGILTIGNNCIINDGVEIITATHDYNSLQWEQIGKEVIIEDYTWLATGCKVLPGVTIGYGAVVGAGSIVTKDVPPMAIIAGNPGKIKGYRKCVHSGFPTEKLNGADFISYLKVLLNNY